MAKRPGTPQNGAQEKRSRTSGASSQRTAINANTEDTLTPAFKPGHYKMITMLKPVVTGSEAWNRWPAVQCDEEMLEFLLLSKETPKDAKQVHAHPGVFLETLVPHRTTVIPMYLIGKDAVFFVPSNLMSVIHASALRILVKDHNEPTPFRQALKLLVRQTQSDVGALVYWKKVMRGAHRNILKASRHTLAGNEGSNDAQQNEGNQYTHHSSFTADSGTHKETGLVETVQDGFQPRSLMSVDSQLGDEVDKDNRSRWPLRVQRSENQTLLHKCSADEVRVTVAKGEEFIIRRDGILKSHYMVHHIEHDEEDDEYKLAHHKLNKISAQDFQPVADLLNYGDFHPEVMINETGMKSLNNFEYNDNNCGRLIARCVKMFELAKMLGIGLLFHKAAEKFKMMAHQSPSAFIGFMLVMKDLDLSKNEELSRWSVRYAADHFFSIMTSNPQEFSSLMSEPSEFTREVFGRLAGLQVLAGSQTKPNKARKAHQAPNQAQNQRPGSAAKLAGTTPLTMTSKRLPIPKKTLMELDNSSPLSSPSSSRQAQAGKSLKTAAELVLANIDVSSPEPTKPSNSKSSELPKQPRKGPNTANSGQEVNATAREGRKGLTSALSRQDRGNTHEHDEANENLRSENSGNGQGSNDTHDFGKSLFVQQDEEDEEEEYMSYVNWEQQDAEAGQDDEVQHHTEDEQNGNGPSKPRQGHETAGQNRSMNQSNDGNKSSGSQSQEHEHKENDKVGDPQYHGEDEHDEQGEQQQPQEQHDEADRACPGGRTMKLYKNGEIKVAPSTTEPESSTAKKKNGVNSRARVPRSGHADIDTDARPDNANASASASASTNKPAAKSSLNNNAIARAKGEAKDKGGKKTRTKTIKSKSPPPPVATAAAPAAAPLSPAPTASASRSHSQSRSSSPSRSRASPSFSSADNKTAPKNNTNLIDDLAACQ